MDKEFDLIRAFLNYASLCLREGDASSLREIGFSEREAHAVDNLNVRQFSHLAQALSGGFLKAQLDSRAFWGFIDQVTRQEEIEQTKIELIRRDAPLEMMQQAFGMGARQYTILRKRCSVDSGVGRPKGADEEDVRALWLAWDRIVGEGQHPRETQWLQLAEEAGVSVRTIWRFAQGWIQTPPPSETRLRNHQLPPDSRGATCPTSEPPFATSAS